MSKSLQSREHECLVLSAAEVAELLAISLRHLWSCHASGRLGPRPIALGRIKRWRADELRDWIKAGAPPRDEWDRMRNRGDEGQQPKEEADG
jgi:predicted DNA-binding transcriptional regulator AlpA